MSTNINVEINNQGKMIDTIENNVDETEENTKKAYKEALETEIIMNKSKKKLYCLAIIIFFTFGINCVHFYRIILINYYNEIMLYNILYLNLL